MIIAQSELADIRARNPGKKIVLTSGTFDLLHVGHLHYLEDVKAYGDIVVVLLSGDMRVKTRKGAERPIIPENDRAALLDALKVVDYVCIDPGDPAKAYAAILAQLQPDLYVTDGEDVRFSTILDRGKQVILPRAQGGAHASTTAIIERIINGIGS